MREKKVKLGTWKGAVGNEVTGILQCLWVWLSVGKRWKPSKMRKYVLDPSVLDQNNAMNKAKIIMKHNNNITNSWITMILEANMAIDHVNNICKSSWTSIDIVGRVKEMNPTFRLDSYARAESWVKQTKNEKKRWSWSAKRCT